MISCSEQSGERQEWILPQRAPVFLGAVIHSGNTQFPRRFLQTFRLCIPLSTNL